MQTLSMNRIETGVDIDGAMFRNTRLTKDDIDEDLSTVDVGTIEEFENAWEKFIRSRPEILPPGQKLKSCRNIKTRTRELEGKKENVCLELQRQLDFFTVSRDKLEERLAKAKEDAMLQQQEVVRQLEKEIDDIATSDKLLSEVLPWEHFFENIATNASTAHSGSVASLSATTDHTLMAKPSAEALYLANIQSSDVIYAARRGKSKSQLLRAYRIDNALLKAKAAMLRRETERLEKNMNAERMLSRVLMDNDIWGIMASTS